MLHFINPNYIIFFSKLTETIARAFIPIMSKNTTITALWWPALSNLIFNFLLPLLLLSLSLLSDLRNH